MSSIPNKFDASYYDEKYFADQKGKEYNRPDGSTDNWGYKNPEGEWLGCKPIVEAWKSIFNPKNALDVGCGRGTFVAYMRDIGIKAEGFDFSGWSINNHYPRCNKKWIKNYDATKPWPYPDKSFGLVTVLDLMEHIYTDDIDFVINEMYRVAKKWIFLQIATVGGGSGSGIHEKGYVLIKGEQVPVELQGCAVAGHVTVSTEGFWIQRLKRDGWIVRRNLVEEFCRIIPKDVIANWVLNTILILERI
jgi:SAM-dependent methyltransferase